MLPHSSTNFKTQKFFKRNLNLEIFIQKKDGAYVINLDEYKPIFPHWVALYMNGDNINIF